MHTEPVAGLRLSPSPAVQAFLFDFDQVAPAYEYDWSRQESFQRRAAYLNSGGYRGDRPALAAALREYNQALGADAATLANIDRLAGSSTLAVVTGQQAGVFCGPAYSIFKAISAIHVARQQSERLGVPVVPVFWVAGEDHDWHEVASVLASGGESVTRVALQETFEGERRSVGAAPIPASLAEVLPKFLEMLPQTEFTADVAARISSAAWDESATKCSDTGGKPTLADWFARLMTWLFAGTGLIICCSNDFRLRRLEADFFARVILRHGEVDQALERGFDRWAQLGFAPTVDRQPGNLNLFTYLQGERLPLTGDETHAWVRDHGQLRWSKAELMERALAHPELFSTNVVLRPVVQGILFPDLAYMGGPGEISYFGLLRDVFAALGQQMPVVCPRESYTLIEPPVARILEKQGLSLADAFFHLDEKREEVLQREDRLGIPSLFQQFRQEFAAKYEPLVDSLLLLDPTLKFVADENRKQIAAQIAKLEEKAAQQHRKNCEVALRQFERIRVSLMPDGLQERAVTILPFVAKYGPDLVARLVAETGFDQPWSHKAIFLGT